ncbi:MAG: 2-amino-4-hydroxy-6-hydroxymethyldihydropteridine diphosphokinase, partial [Acidobacteriota bacterium]
MVSRWAEAVKPRVGRRAREWIVLALGSNLGDREGSLARARRELSLAGVPWALASRVIETVPVGGPAGQPKYLNQVLAAAVEALALPPYQLLAVCQRIERQEGPRSEVRWGPRRLDIDIVLLGDELIREPELVIPHPRLHQRAFVLEP